MKLSEWIDWEIKYSLREVKRGDRYSGTNGIIGVVMEYNGGKLSLEMRKLRVKAVASKMPESVTINVEKLELGKTIQVRALSFEGLEILNTPNAVVCAVKLTRAARGAAATAVK